MSQKHDDLEEIRQLKYKYCRFLDMADFLGCESLFAPNASVHYMGGSYTFTAEGRANIIAALKYAFHAEVVASHQVHHPEIALISHTEATGIWYLKDWFLNLREKSTTEGTAIYKDKYVKIDNKWHIDFASYERIYEIVTPLTHIPNLTAHYLAKHAPKLPSGR